VLLWELVDAAAFNNQDGNDDEITGTRSPDGSYSARSAYHIQFDGSSESIFLASVWKQWASSKYKFFLWLLLQNRVWTTDRLMQRDWPNQYFCTFRRRNLEKVAHVCLHSRWVWEAIAGWASLQTATLVA
jgi:hypothetical protein